VSDAPLWRQAFDAVERRVTPPAEQLVRTPGFAVAAALVGRGRSVARGAARGLTARAWHLVNLPAGSDVSRLRTQVGALDREVRRLTVALETERRRSTTRSETDRPETGEPHADGAQPADGARPRPARRGAQRPAGS
jgi:hypothetical protein